MKIKLSIFALIMLFILTSYAYSEEITVKVGVSSQEVFKGESFIFQITVDGSDSPEKPDTSLTARSSRLIRRLRIPRRSVHDYDVPLPQPLHKVFVSQPVSGQVDIVQVTQVKERIRVFYIVE